MDRYRYEGAVMVFDRCVADHWEAETIASSSARARANFAYRYKKEEGYLPDAQVKLPGKVRKVS